MLSVNNRVDGRPLDEDDRIFLETLAPRVSELLERHADWEADTRAFHESDHPTREQFEALDWPGIAAIRQARKALDDVGKTGEISLIYAGGIRNGGDIGVQGDPLLHQEQFDVVPA